MEISFIGKRIHVPKLVSDWLEFDRAFGVKIMAGDWGRMTKSELEYAAWQIASAIALAIALTACGRALNAQNRLIEAPAVQPSIGVITEATAANNPVTLAELDKIRSSSSNPSNCKPQEIVVNSPKGPEKVGLCRIVRTDGLQGSQIVSRESVKGTEIINEPLLGYRQSDGRIIVGYKHHDRLNGINQVMVIYKDGSSEYIYGNGMRIAFDKKQTQQAGFNFENFIGKLIEPGGVAQAAEIDTPTPTATATLKPATPTTPPTETPTLVTVDHMPVNLSPDQQATWNLAPDLTGTGLTKSVFLVDNQFNFLMYTDANGHVTKVYDAEGARMDNALQVGSNNFILNEGSASIIINPKRSYDSASTAISQAVDYFRLKLCANAKNVSLPVGDLSDILKSDFAKQNSSCDVTLKSTSRTWESRYNAKDWNYAVGQQGLNILPETPLIFRVVDKPTQNMVYTIGGGENSDAITRATGVSIEQNNGVVIVNMFEKGSPLPSDYSDFLLAFRLSSAMRTLLDRVEKSNVSYPNRDFVLESILYNPYTFKPASPVIFTR